MSESRKLSEDIRSQPPPPTDPFTRFSQPWPRTEKDDENPFIQFRRFADESFNSFFSGFPSMFNSFQRASQDLHSSFEKQLEEQLKRSAAMEEVVRKEIEQSLEEMKQALNKNQPDRFQEASRSEPESALPSAWSWWSKGLHACPSKANKDGEEKTELAAYEQSDSSKDAKLGASPYKWNSALGWDGKVKKSLEQAQEQAWSRLKNQEEQGESPKESHNEYRIYGHRHTADMNPITETLDTIPWLVLSPYSPVYLCNPDQPSAVLAGFSTNFREPFHMEVFRYKDRSTDDRDLSERLARKLPWADAFEDLISLEQTGKMVDRETSSHRTPATWIHDMVKRGSLGPTWALNSTGQLALQKYAWLPGENTPAKSTAGESLRVEDAADAREAQSVLDAVRNQRAQGSSELLSHSAAPGKAEELCNEAGDHYHPGAIVQGQNPSSSATATQEESSSSSPNWTSSSSTTWSSFSSHSSGSISDSGDPDNIISETIKTETKTLADGSVQTKSTRKWKYADGREESEENIEFMPSPMRKQQAHQKQLQQPNLSGTPVQDALKEQMAENKGKQQKGGWFWN